jgi:hypothetical protein
VNVAPASERLERDGALLSRGDLAELGLPRRAVDAVFRALPNVILPGYARPFVKADDWQRFVDDNTYRGDRVVPR